MSDLLLKSSDIPFSIKISKISCTITYDLYIVPRPSAFCFITLQIITSGF